MFAQSAPVEQAQHAPFTFKSYTLNHLFNMPTQTNDKIASISQILEKSWNSLPNSHKHSHLLVPKSSLYIINNNNQENQQIKTSRFIQEQKFPHNKKKKKKKKKKKTKQKEAKHQNNENYIPSSTLDHGQQ